MRAVTPLTLGTAGHIDHGKTTLVRALTGVDTDRLPQERERGMSIELGYAPLDLGIGRPVSLIDVPGHARFVRTMVAGATGIDAYLMVIAADDGVMPQTREHALVLDALGVDRGVVAITKSDLADSAPAIAQAQELLGERTPVVVVNQAPPGGGDHMVQLRAELAKLLAPLPGRGGGGEGEGARLHVDRAFSVRGVGTVVTGTLWSGSVAAGDELVLLPAATRVRVRGVQVHNRAVAADDDGGAPRAVAGQRVAVNLTSVRVADVRRGDLLAAAGAGVAACFRLDAALAFGDEQRPEHGDRVHVHHGTREAPARIASLGGRFWQLRLEAPLLALAGDRVVIRSPAPPRTLGGGVVLDAAPRRHGPSRDVTARLTALADGRSPSPPAPGPPESPATPSQSQSVPAPLSQDALGVEAALRAAWLAPPIESQLTQHQRGQLAALRAAGRVVRAGRALHFHVDAVAAARERVEAIAARDGTVTLAALRDDLQTSRKFAQALLEHFDAARVTRRLEDDARVLRGRR